MVNLAPIGSFQKFKKKKWILILHNKIPKQPLVKDFFKNPQKTKTKRAQTPSTSRSCYVLPSVLAWIPSLGQLHYPREKETGVNNNTHTQDTPGMNGTLSKSWWSRLQWRRQQHFKTHTSWVYCSETGSVIFLLYLNMCLITWSRKRPFIPMLY